MEEVSEKYKQRFYMEEIQRYKDEEVSTFKSVEDKKRFKKIFSFRKLLKTLTGGNKDDGELQTYL